MKAQTHSHLGSSRTNGRIFNCSRAYSDISFNLICLQMEVVAQGYDFDSSYKFTWYQLQAGSCCPKTCVFRVCTLVGEFFPCFKCCGLWHLTVDLERIAPSCDPYQIVISYLTRSQQHQVFLLHDSVSSLVIRLLQHIDLLQILASVPKD